MIRAGWVTLKLHRVEVAIAIGVALFTAAWATWVAIRAAGVEVPVPCAINWVATVEDALCAGPMHAWFSIQAEAGDTFRQLTEFLPFMLGALIGVPIVAGEIEGRTTGIAWSLSPSRVRWLVRQVVPVVLVAGTAIGAAAIGAEVTEQNVDKFSGGFQDVSHIGHYGYGLVARWFGVVGVGVALGVLLGRQLPAFLLTVMMGIGFLTGLTPVRDAWLRTHEAHVIDGIAASWPTDWGFRSPDGLVLGHDAANAVVPPEIAALDEGSVQPLHAAAWLEEHGYAAVLLGIDTDAAMGWAPYEAAAYSLLGGVSLVLAAWLVNRRRVA